MPAEYEIHKEIENYLRIKTGVLQLNIDQIDSITLSKIKENAMKKTQCTEEQFEREFKKMKDDGDIKEIEFDLKKIHVLKGTDIKQCKEKTDKNLLNKWFVGFAAVYLLVGLFEIYSGVIAGSFHSLLLLVAGSIIMLAGETALSLSDKLTERAVKLGKQYETALTFVTYLLYSFVGLFVLMYVSASLLKITVVTNQDTLLTVIGMAVVISVGMMGKPVLDQFIKTKNVGKDTK
ncbi:MAG: hypothetical protein ABIJ74_03915 [archaeon]